VSHTAASPTWSWPLPPGWRSVSCSSPASSSRPAGITRYHVESVASFQTKATLGRIWKIFETKTGPKVQIFSQHYMKFFACDSNVIKVNAGSMHSATYDYRSTLCAVHNFKIYFLFPWLPFELSKASIPFQRVLHKVSFSNELKPENTRQSSAWKRGISWSKKSPGKFNAAIQR
jgi:hypothetical protein